MGSPIPQPQGAASQKAQASAGAGLSTVAVHSIFVRPPPPQIVMRGVEAVYFSAKYAGKKEERVRVLASRGTFGWRRIIQAVWPIPETRPGASTWLRGLLSRLRSRSMALSQLVLRRELSRR